MTEIPYAAKVVHWEDDPSKTRLVTGYCQRCDTAGDDFEIVAPTGTAHHSGDEGKTRCGIDATGNDWWWRT